MTNPKHILGSYGEQVACDYLASQNYEVLDRNWRCSIGELDLVARDHETLVFVEVKTRNGRGFGHPFEAITDSKRTRLRQLSNAWLASNSGHPAKIRIDAISVLIEQGRVSIEHLKEVF
ncbi:MAG: YraN family protein [Micrococcales bacterium]